MNYYFPDNMLEIAKEEIRNKIHENMIYTKDQFVRIPNIDIANKLFVGDIVKLIDNVHTFFGVVVEKSSNMVCIIFYSGYENRKPTRWKYTEHEYSMSTTLDTMPIFYLYSCIKPTITELSKIINEIYLKEKEKVG